MNIENAVVYDIECLPNIFTFGMEMLNSDVKAVWEISEWRDDRKDLLEFFNWLSSTQTPMIGFNNQGYDYPVIHELWKNPSASFQQLRMKNDMIIGGTDRFSNMVWASDRFAPQIDLYKIHHFDNRAKSTGLKTLQISMRSSNVVEGDIPFDKPVPFEKRDTVLIPYNRHDVSETKKFAHYSMEAINFRVGLIPQFGLDVLNWNDTKIGEQTVIQRLGDMCYDRTSGRKQPRQTVRSSIHLKDIIFSYVRFTNPEFQKILNCMSEKILTPDEYQGDEDGVPVIKTKGVFKDVKAFTGGVEYHYGVGGIHGSLKRARVVSGGGYIIKDIDVASLYPSIAIVNNLAPEHLGTSFTQVYSQLPLERKKWQIEKGKKCIEANTLKLASNGVYGKSNSVFSPFYDPQFTMQITVNGQLLLSMLIEKLIEIPTLKVLQANTDGVTYMIHQDCQVEAEKVCKEWEKLTCLVLEDAEYQKMFIRDVNNYVAVSKDGSVKLKGEYWTPDPSDYYESVASSQPPSWHKSFDKCVSVRAAVAHMIHGVDIEQFIRFTTNPYDFCCSVKIKRSDKLFWGDKEQQRNTRFYVSKNGARLIKHLPSQGTLGSYKKANGVSDSSYNKKMLENGGEWDPSVCTKNKSKYEKRESQIISGYNVTICNNIEDFDWSNVNYDWYVKEALELVIN